MSCGAESGCEGDSREEVDERIHNWVTLSRLGGCVKPFKAQKSPVGLPGWFRNVNGYVLGLRRKIKQEEMPGAGNLYTRFIPELCGIPTCQSFTIYGH